jgi:hypothetical protein
MVLDGVAPPAMRTTLDVWPARERRCPFWLHAAQMRIANARIRI